MRTSLEGRVVMITGAARGIGAETARQLASRGARLSLVGLEPELLAERAAALGPGHLWFACDVTRQEQLEHAAAQTADQLGGIDVVIANAGIAPAGTLAVTPVAVQAKTIEVNLTGVLRTVVATLPHVAERRGQLVLIASAASFAALPGMAAYAAAKAGVEQLANVLRLELMHRGVSVCCVHPGWIDTDLMRDLEQDLATVRETMATLPGPFGRRTTVEACAAAIVDGIERRRRRVFVPRSLGMFAALRQLLSSGLAERMVASRARRNVPLLEGEVRALGRSFGEHSAGPDSLARDASDAD
jgi:NAD(P)-dependent dehydrogenase (short-subunit alcohol dehydrogenase family)